MYSALSPVQFCEKQKSLYVNSSDPDLRKARGQFFTPGFIAEFMASLYEYRKKCLRILDAGAGIGILSCAVCEAAVYKKNIKKIEIDAYEDHPPLIAHLKKSLQFAKKWLSKHCIELSYNIIEKDFILNSSQNLIEKRLLPYDLTIGNPPYFKISKQDPRAKEASRFVYGQPNIYALFMGVAAELLHENGLMVFITPRSYASGSYFKRFRENFFKMMTPERIHVFESRNDAFKKDEVLQENIILKARRFKKSSTLTISISNGLNDLVHSKKYKIPLSRVLHSTRQDIILRFPVSDDDIKIIDIVESWRGSLHKYGLEISTGPVVPFRANKLILNTQHKKPETVPLLWMQNVQMMEVQWPRFNMNNGRQKPQFIIKNEETIKRRLLVSDQNTVLLRRFSAKEYRKRLMAAPLFRSQLGSKLIGIENHINYIYSPTGHLNKYQTLGLTVLLNSSLLDKYFRISNGNTQVSATEIRAMPLPSIRKIEAIGKVTCNLDHVLIQDEIDNLLSDNLAK